MILLFLVFHQDWNRVDAVLIVIGNVYFLGKRSHFSKKYIVSKTNCLSIFYPLFMSVTDLSFIKSGGINGFFCYYRIVLE